MEEDKHALILNGDMNKVIFTLALPIMASNLIQTIYDITDTYFVGKLAGNEVAAIQLVGSIIFMMISFGLGMALATSSIIAQYIGSGQKGKAEKAAGQVVSLLFVLSFIIGIAGYFISPFIIRWMGATGMLYQNAVDYLSIMFLGMPFMFMTFSFNAIKQGQGDTIRPMIVSALSVTLNIILDPIFIFVLGKGIKGAAIATVIARGIFAIISISTVFSKNQGFVVSFKDLKPDFNYAKKIISIGIPSSLGQSMQSLGFVILNVFLISFGDEILTSFAIGNRINSIVMMPAMGIGSALATIVGQNLGANNIPRAKEAIKKSVIFSTTILVIGGGMMFPFAEKLVMQFTKDPYVIANGTEYLRMIIISVPLMGIFQILIGIFQGSGHTVSAMIIMMGRLWGIRIPVIYFLSKSANFRPSYVWYVMVISNFIICIIGFIIYLKGNWQKKVIENENHLTA